MNQEYPEGSDVPPQDTTGAVLDESLVLFREDLSWLASKHSETAGDIFYLHPRCHANAALEVSFCTETGHMVVACAVCHSVVSRVVTQCRD